MTRLVEDVISEWMPAWYYHADRGQQYRLTHLKDNVIRVEPSSSGEDARTFAIAVVVRELG